MTSVVVAGLWARPLAEAARQAGWRAIALDLFGDADTRRASVAWRRIGDPSLGTIDPLLLREALHEAARAHDAIGWVAGSGFEALPEALDSVVPGLPLLGVAGAAVRRVRDPAEFFGVLDALGLDHPEVAFSAPRDPRGWLVKDSAGSGGWHIRAACNEPPSFPRRREPWASGENPSFPRRREPRASAFAASTECPGSPPPRERRGLYFQRLHPGQPMSALFLANGQRARVVALNRLLVERGFLYAGAIGPIRDDALLSRIGDALAALVPAFALRGLASLDFLLDNGRPSLLEINPRPSASMVLHPHAWPLGLLHAHVRAVQGELPEPPMHPPGVRGHRIVFAQRPCRIDEDPGALQQVHDVPAPGTSFSPGEPVCTVSTRSAGAPCALADLDARANRILARLTAPQELPA